MYIIKPVQNITYKQKIFLIILSWTEFISGSPNSLVKTKIFITLNTFPMNSATIIGIPSHFYFCK